MSTQARTHAHARCITYLLPSPYVPPGCTVVLFDGNPMYPAPGALWQLAQDAGVTLFGCSARYLQAVEDSGCVPGREYDLHKLRTVMSTGSPSTVNTFAFVYKSIKADVQFASISGGTDLNGCFALGSPMVPGSWRLASTCGGAPFDASM